MTQTGGTFRALRHRDFRLYFAGSLISNIGTWMQGVAQGWLVLELTQSEGWLGTVGFLATLPALVATPLAGVIADQINRRRLMLALQTTMMLCAASIGLLRYTGTITLGSLCALVFLSGLALAINGPSFSATVRDLTGKEDLHSGVGLISSQFHLSRAFGPLCAAALIASVGIAGCFFLNAASFLAFIGALLLIRPAQAGVDGSGVLPLDSSLRGLRASFLTGARYTAKEPVTRWLMVYTAIQSLLGLPLATQLPAMSKKVFFMGAEGLSYLTAANGSGALLGALLSAYAGTRLGWRRAAFYGGLLSATGFMLFSQAHQFAYAVALQVLIGFAQVLTAAVGMATVQSTVPDEVRGRVMSLYSVAFMGAMTIGNLGVGWLAEGTSAPRMYLVNGALLVLGVLIMALVAPRPPRSSDPGEPGEPAAPPGGAARG